MPLCISFFYTHCRGKDRNSEKKIIDFFGEWLLIVTANSKNVQGQKFGKKNRWLFEEIAFDSS